MDRTLVDKFIKKSEEATTTSDIDYYWGLAESLDHIYDLQENALRLKDRNMVIRCCEKVFKYAELEEKDTMNYWIEKTIHTNKTYNEVKGI